MFVLTQSIWLSKYLLANFRGLVLGVAWRGCRIYLQLVLGCIDTNFRNKILAGKLSQRSIRSTFPWTLGIPCGKHGKRFLEASQTSNIHQFFVTNVDDY